MVEPARASRSSSSRAGNDEEAEEDPPSADVSVVGSLPGPSRKPASRLKVLAKKGTSKALMKARQRADQSFNKTLEPPQPPKKKSSQVKKYQELNEALARELNEERQRNKELARLAQEGRDLLTERTLEVRKYKKMYEKALNEKANTSVDFSIVKKKIQKKLVNSLYREVEVLADGFTKQSSDLLQLKDEVGRMYRGSEENLLLLNRLLEKMREAGSPDSMSPAGDASSSSSVAFGNSSLRSPNVDAVRRQQSRRALSLGRSSMGSFADDDSVNMSAGSPGVMVPNRNSTRMCGVALPHVSGTAIRQISVQVDRLSVRSPGGAAQRASPAGVGIEIRRRRGSQSVAGGRRTGRGASPEVVDLDDDDGNGHVDGNGNQDPAQPRPSGSNSGAGDGQAQAIERSESTDDDDDDVTVEGEVRRVTASPNHRPTSRFPRDIRIIVDPVSRFLDAAPRTPRTPRLSTTPMDISQSSSGSGSVRRAAPPHVPDTVTVEPGVSIEDITMEDAEDVSATGDALNEAIVAVEGAEAAAPGEQPDSSSDDFVPGSSSQQRRAAKSVRFDRRDLDVSSDVPHEDDSVADAIEESAAAPGPGTAGAGGGQENETEPEETRAAGDAETDGDDEDFRPSKAKRARGSQKDKAKKPQSTNGRKQQQSTSAAAGGSNFFDEQGDPLPSTSGVSTAAVASASSAAAVGSQQPSDDVDDGENEDMANDDEPAEEDPPAVTPDPDAQTDAAQDHEDAAPGGRSRRNASKSVSYKEPTLNAKLRQGDPMADNFSSILAPSLARKSKHPGKSLGRKGQPAKTKKNSH